MENFASLSQLANDNYYVDVDHDDIILYLDECGTIWVMKKDDIVELNYTRVENYHVCDMPTLELDKTMDYYYGHNDEQRLDIARSIVRALRHECLKQYRILHYAQQLVRIKNKGVA
jgi:hypothetical protein